MFNMMKCNMTLAMSMNYTAKHSMHSSLPQNDIAARFNKQLQSK